MSAKTSDWRPGPTVCRCCFADGCYKDISTEYFWMGKREVYSEMLTETFSVSIGYQSAGPNSNSRLICEACIARLRDASDFKRQVQECEKTFMQHLDPSGSLDDMILESEREVKLETETVKLKDEKHSDDDYDDASFGIDDMDDDDDDLDDQPLTAFKAKVPKKEVVEIIETAKPEKRKAPTKLKVSPAKKLKKKEAPKPAPSKAPVTEKKDKKKDGSRRTVARHNAKMIIQFATAYPFRLPQEVPVCVFCAEKFDDLARFREHMEADHKTFRLTLAFAHLNEGYVKADCTDLRCRLCPEKFTDLDAVALHLKFVHKKCIDPSYDLGIQPFVVEKGQWFCTFCKLKCLTLRALSRHMQTHYAQFTCESCGKSYSTMTCLKRHISFTHGARACSCRKCKLKFNSNAELREHLLSSKKCCLYVCGICYDRFISWEVKMKHMSEVHSKPRKNHPCTECELVFEKQSSLRTHFKIVHTEDYLQCSCCGMKFESSYRLERHMLTHTGEKLYSCHHCAKAFVRKSTLTQHMWIHKDEKKWKCAPCNKQFNQRVSLKSHIKTHHPEINLADIHIP